MNYSDEREKVWKLIEGADTFYIYGAQAVAYGVYTAIREVSGKLPKAFLVSCLDNNPSKIENIPVVEANGKLSPDALIIVSVPEIYHEEIKERLDRFGLVKALYVDTHVEYLIMSRYFQKQGHFVLLEDLQLKNEDAGEAVNVKMYMAKHHKDRVLKREYDLPSWIAPIQVGASQTDMAIAELSDNTGDNISDKNSKYSELTAMYWAWKNRDDDYLGICHYRRILVLVDDDILRIRQNGINVVLPLPFICYPDASGQYGRYISADDQQKMFQALSEISPEYYKAAKIILKKQYLYNYNMFLADRTTFRNFCRWMFPILERAEGLCETEDAERKDRYLGYFGEVLTAIYFIYNKDNLKIAHAEKKWMV